MATDVRKLYHLCRTGGTTYAGETYAAALTASGASGATVVEMFKAVANSSTIAALLPGKSGAEAGLRFKGTAADADTFGALYD